MRLILVPAFALLAAACGGGESGLPGEDTAAPVPPAETADETAQMPDEPIVGGPCSYEETIIDAHVVAVEEDRVELAETGGEPFYMPVEDFDAVPQAGEAFTLRWESITEGTCTPDIYTIVGGDTGGVE